MVSKFYVIFTSRIEKVAFNVGMNHGRRRGVTKESAQTNG